MDYGMWPTILVLVLCVLVHVSLKVFSYREKYGMFHINSTNHRKEKVSTQTRKSYLIELINQLSVDYRNGIERTIDDDLRQISKRIDDAREIYDMYSMKLDELEKEKNKIRKELDLAKEKIIQEAKSESKKIIVDTRNKSDDMIREAKQKTAD